MAADDHLGMTACNPCISWAFLLLCKWLPRKTCLWIDLLCVEWDVKLYYYWCGAMMWLCKICCCCSFHVFLNGDISVTQINLCWPCMLNYIQIKIAEYHLPTRPWTFAIGWYLNGDSCDAYCFCTLDGPFFTYWPLVWYHCQELLLTCKICCFSVFVCLLCGLFWKTLPDLWWGGKVVIKALNILMITDVMSSIKSVYLCGWRLVISPPVKSVTLHNRRTIADCKGVTDQQCCWPVTALHLENIGIFSLETGHLLLQIRAATINRL